MKTTIQSTTIPTTYQSEMHYFTNFLLNKYNKNDNNYINQSEELEDKTRQCGHVVTTCKFNYFQILCIQLFENYFVKKNF
jgi:hypothetical protein